MAKTPSAETTVKERPGGPTEAGREKKARRTLTYHVTINGTCGEGKSQLKKKGTDCRSKAFLGGSYIPKR